jgi:hypothetical protein
MKQIFCLTKKPPLTIRSGDSYHAIEFHTLGSAAARIGAPRSSVHRWIQSGDLPAKVSPDGRYRFEAHHLEQFALRLKAEAIRKQREAAARTQLSAVIADPAAATTDDLLDQYMQAPDPATRGQIWTEVSKRYKEYPHVTAQAITQATRRNSERLAGQPKFANVYNKQTQRTERVRIQ